MAASLPDDLLHMICGALWEQQDFDTLYHCALAGKRLAYPAVSSLYRRVLSLAFTCSPLSFHVPLLIHGSMHNVAPVTGAGNDEFEQSNQDEKRSYKEIREKQERITMKWANMWRSIITSSLGRTMYPYSQFIRTLQLADLHDLLSDGKFGQTTRIGDAFFDGELAQYRVNRSINGSRKRKSYDIIDAEATVNNFAEVITQYTPMLEEFSGPNQPFDGETLARSIPRLGNLQYLRIFYGEALEGLGSLLNKHCPLFNKLLIYGWRSAQGDQDCATLLSEMRPNSLRSFQMQGMGTCGAETFLALNNHRDSLKELQLDGISAEAMPALSMAKGCINLNSIVLSEVNPPIQDLEKRHNDIFLEVVAWLRECRNLRTISLTHFLSGPALLTPLLLENEIKLNRLELENYAMADSKEFHQALAHQTSLRYLGLSGEGVDAGHPDNDVLVEAISKLDNLIDLRLKEVSDGFSNSHIIRLAQDLSKLEYFGTSGYGVNDEIWQDLSSLTSLRHFETNAISRFTANGIMDFVLNLEKGNHGMVLGINMQENDADISEEEQAMIRETLHTKLDGRFTLTLWKDPDAEDYSVESD